VTAEILRKTSGCQTFFHRAMLTQLVSNSTITVAMDMVCSLVHHRHGRFSSLSLAFAVRLFFSPPCLGTQRELWEQDVPNE
jgi:hypothetical protein